ncbi:hypothetical protein V1264_017168 [Littorina saxatilis]|uniref:Endonuclease n=1 Tax=Littorina saxatilis TaxID=31220 RepID=A0AAN9BHN2_9CAEN
MPGFKPPENFDFRQPAGWQAWRERFARFRLASKLNKEDGDVQVSSFIYAMGAQAESIFKQFALTAEQQKSFDIVAQRFDTHFTPKRNLIHERALFHQRSQQQGETIEEYVRDLFKLAEFTEFPDRDNTIRDRVVLGVTDQNLSQKLQLEPDLDLDKAVTMARQHEQVKAQMAEQRGVSSNVDEVNKSSVGGSSFQRGRGRNHGHRGGAQGFSGHRGSSSSHRGGSSSHRGGSTSQRGGRQSGQRSCYKCGNSPHERGTVCPAMGKTCRACGKSNHFQSVCRSKQTLDNLTNSEQGEKFFLGSLETTENEPPWRVSLSIGNRVVNFKIDTGADVSVISESEFNKMSPRPKLHTSHAKLESPGGPVENMGQFVAQTSFKGKRTTFRVYVLRGETDSLLSRSTALKLGLVKRLDEMNNLAFGDIGVPVKCDPIKIVLNEDAEPYSISVPRRVPIPLLPKVERELQRMLSDGIIEKVTEPTDWCAPIVPVLKKNGNVRICVDLKRLNRSVKRERYTLPTLEDMTHKLAGAKVFTKLDATSGFWQIPLQEESAKLTTFMTPFGRFYFKRLPFGISLAPEIFQRTMEDMLQGIDGVVCFMDDVVVSGDSEAEHDERLRQVLERVRQAGLKLNKEKCEFRKTKLDFLGHTISQDGIQPDLSKVKAIIEMTEPQDVSELRRFLGMVNYLGRFIPNLADILKPLNALLHKDTQWIWDSEQRQAFEQVKKSITDAPTLAFYELGRETVVCSDASSYGLGGVLYQVYEGELKPVAFCSRTLTSAECKYAQIEKECLAGVYACEKFQRYLTGLPEFKLITDHRPLVPLINKKDLTDTPLRCQRMLMRLMRHNVVAEYEPGKNLVVADALSRSPLAETESPEQNTLETDVQVHVDAVRASWSVSDEKLEALRKATQEDVTLQTALEYTRSGWPQYKEDVKLAAREFYSVKDELSDHDGLLVRGSRIVIPFSHRKDILGKIHDGHQGIQKCRERANQCVWWSGMGQEIKEMVGRCRHCLESKPTQRKEPLITSKLPEYPFQKVGVDLLAFRGENYLSYVDYYSRFIEIEQLSRETAEEVIGKLKDLFSRHGVPEIVVSDNGTQFTSEKFQDFRHSWGFTHVTSSPRYPQSNGEAERSVQTSKTILKQSDVALALLSYRATPIPSLGASPAELAFGRQLRTRLPSLPKSLIPQTPVAKDFKERDRQAKQQQKENYDRRHGVQSLPTLEPGETVKIKIDGEDGWRQSGRVVEQCATRSYVVQTPTGRLRRNRRHLRRAPTGEEMQIRDETVPKSPAAGDSGGAETVELELPDPPDVETSPVRTRSGREVKLPLRFQ